MSASWKAFRVLGHVYFLVLLVLASVYFLERTIILDSALQIFKWLQFSGFNIEAGRISAIIPQVIPKILIWFGMPLEMVLFSASISFILVFYAVFIIVVHGFGSTSAGICIMLALTLCSLRTFYFSVVEVHQALVYPFLLLAWLQYSKNKTSYRFLQVSAMIMSLNYLTHPSTLMTVIFVLGYYVIQNEQIRKKWPYQLLGFTFAFFISRWAFFSVGTYESDLYNDAMNISPALQNIWNLPGIRFILDQIWHDNTLFLIPTLMLLWSTFAMISGKKYLLATFYLVSISLFILVTAITFQRGDSAMMMEKNLLALGIFISMGFVMEVVMSKKMDQRVVFVIVLAVVFLKIRDISLAGAKVAKPRLAAVQQVVDLARANASNKLILKDADVPSKISVIWGLPIETLLLSSLNEKGSVSVIVKSQMEQLDPDTSNDDLVIIPFVQHSESALELNGDYFDLDPGPYKKP